MGGVDAECFDSADQRPTNEVTRYLGGVERDEVDDLDSSGDPEYSRRSGGRVERPAGRRDVLGRVEGGCRRADARWEPEDGDWQAVVMNEDASRGVSAELSIGAELDSILWMGIGLLLAGALFAAGRALAITAAARRGR
jgi:hypothetical protein